MESLPPVVSTSGPLGFGSSIELPIHDRIPEYQSPPLEDGKGKKHKVIKICRSAKLEDFEKLLFLGSGFYGKVYLVQYKVSQQLYAMKEVKKSDMLEPKEMDKIIVEKKILSQVDHPFLIHMHCWFHDADKFYYILDYIPGGELFKAIGLYGTIPLNQVRLYAAEIVLALEYLHTRGVVYRDLKPENILLTAAGHVKLTDFGLSKVADPDATSCGRTLCGTPEYMAPEVVSGKAHGRAVDWWALGVLVYEMIVGAGPFRAREQTDVFQRIVSGEIHFPKRVGPVARAFISALLDRDRRTRLGSGVNGAQAVKRHAFFEGFDWDKVRRCKYRPVFLPTVPPPRGLPASSHPPSPTVERRRAPRARLMDPTRSAVSEPMGFFAAKPTAVEDSFQTSDVRDFAGSASSSSASSSSEFRASDSYVSAMLSNSSSCDSQAPPPISEGDAGASLGDPVPEPPGAAHSYTLDSSSGLSGDDCDGAAELGDVLGRAGRAGFPLAPWGVALCLGESSSDLTSEAPSDPTGSGSTTASFSDALYSEEETASSFSSTSAASFSDLFAN